MRGPIGQGGQIKQDGQISPLFHEDGQDVQVINLAILPRWEAGFGVGLGGWLANLNARKAA
jgi:hypothetical protein